MKNWDTIQARYLKDPLPIRLGGLASDLSRIKSTAPHEANYSVVDSLMEESKRFIEWTAGDAEPEVSAYLVRIQIALALWQRQLPDRWHNAQDRQRLSVQSGTWSERVLELSGLLAP